MTEELYVVYNGSVYGDYEILREDFAEMLRTLNLHVVEDVDIKESKCGANPKAVKDYAKKNQMIFVTLLIGDIPFYYAVKGNMAKEKIKGWFRELDEE